MKFVKTKVKCLSWLHNSQSLQGLSGSPPTFIANNVSNVRHRAKDMQHSISSIYQLKWCTLKLIIAVLFQSHWEIENKLEVAEKCRWTRIDKIFPPIRMYNSRRVRSCWQNEWNPRWWYISTAVLIWKLLQEQNAAGVEFSRSRFEL